MDKPRRKFNIKDMDAWREKSRKAAQARRGTHIKIKDIEAWREFSRRGGLKSGKGRKLNIKDKEAWLDKIRRGHITRRLNYKPKNGKRHSKGIRTGCYDLVKSDYDVNEMIAEAKAILRNAGWLQDKPEDKPEDSAVFQGEVIADSGEYNAPNIMLVP